MAAVKWQDMGTVEGVARHDCRVLGGGLCLGGFEIISGLLNGDFVLDLVEDAGEERRFGAEVLARLEDSRPVFAGDDGGGLP